MNRIYTGGTFDLFHAGHVNFLRKCRGLAGEGGTVIVSLNTDEFIEAYKGRPPVCTYEERKMVLESCVYVDVVIVNSGNEDSKIAIAHANPSYVVIGSDWAQRDYYKQMGFSQDWLDEMDIGLVYVPYTKSVSTSEIKSRI